MQETPVRGLSEKAMWTFNTALLLACLCLIPTHHTVPEFQTESRQYDAFSLTHHIYWVTWWRWRSWKYCRLNSAWAPVLHRSHRSPTRNITKNKSEMTFEICNPCPSSQPSIWKLGEMESHFNCLFNISRDPALELQSCRACIINCEWSDLIRFPWEKQVYSKGLSATFSFCHSFSASYSLSDFHTEVSFSSAHIEHSVLSKTWDYFFWMGRYMGLTAIWSQQKSRGHGSGPEHLLKHAEGPWHYQSKDLPVGDVK